MNTKPKAAQPKYRPVLTAVQITKILALAKLESPLTEASFSLIATLAPFAAKIANAGIAPAYIPSIPISIGDLGGFTIVTAQHKEQVSQQVADTASSYAAGVDKEQQWELAYKQYKADPISCSLETISAAKEHMYLNDLMSATELAEFEAAMEGSNLL